MGAVNWEACFCPKRARSTIEHITGTYVRLVCCFWRNICNNHTMLIWRLIIKDRHCAKQNSASNSFFLDYSFVIWARHRTDDVERLKNKIHSETHFNEVVRSVEFLRHSEIFVILNLAMLVICFARFGIYCISLLECFWGSVLFKLCLR